MRMILLVALGSVAAAITTVVVLKVLGLNIGSGAIGGAVGGAVGAGSALALGRSKSKPSDDADA